MLVENRRRVLDGYIAECVRIFSGVGIPPDIEKLRENYRKQSFGEMLRLIQQAAKIDCEIKLVIVAEGGEPARAWVKIPTPCPFYGTSSFRKKKFQIFIRTWYLQSAPFYTLVATMAHELSHIILAALQNPLWQNEEATDVAAMVLGYSGYFIRGRIYSYLEQTEGWVFRIPFLSFLARLWQKIFGPRQIVFGGYLSSEEYHYVADRIWNIRAK